MRMIPFFKPKKGFMMAGGGFETSSGGGGGGGGGSSFPDFSITEVDTGLKWIDNSNVYMRTFYMPENAYNFIIDALNSNDNFVICVFACGQDTNKFIMYDKWELTTSSLSISKSGSSSQIKNRYATVLYTKQGGLT